MNLRDRVADLEKKVDRLEWEGRNTCPCHCGHPSTAHWGIVLDGGRNTACMQCRCDAYSVAVEREEARRDA